MVSENQEGLPQPSLTLTFAAHGAQVEPVAEGLLRVNMWLPAGSGGSSGSNSHNWTPGPEACGQEEVG